MPQVGRQLADSTRKESHSCFLMIPWLSCRWNLRRFPLHKCLGWSVPSNALLKVDRCKSGESEEAAVQDLHRSELYSSAYSSRGARLPIRARNGPWPPLSTPQTMGRADITGTPYSANSLALFLVFPNFFAGFRCIFSGFPSKFAWET